MLYEHRKHTHPPHRGVNTFTAPPRTARCTHRAGPSTEEEKQRQLTRLREFQTPRRRAPGPRLAPSGRLDGGNVFAELMATVRHATLGEITATLFEWAAYRRNV